MGYFDNIGQQSQVNDCIFDMVREQLKLYGIEICREGQYRERGTVNIPNQLDEMRDHIGRINNLELDEMRDHTGRINNLENWRYNVFGPQNQFLCGEVNRLESRIKDLETELDTLKKMLFDPNSLIRANTDATTENKYKVDTSYASTQ